MKDFFGDKVLLDTTAAEGLYEKVKDLPIIDYHCHLDINRIATDYAYENLGQLWLAEDHYKWRAMRMCGVDEKYITGDASFEEKFFKYAEIMPKLCGNPLYYWSHFELKQLFGITKPLNAGSAREIYDSANKIISKLSVGKLFQKYNVKYIATTDDPTDNLAKHGKHFGATIAPTFRPDRFLNFDKAAIGELGAATYDDLKAALAQRLDFFCTKGCKITDHGFADFPASYADDQSAGKIFAAIDSASADEIDSLRGNLLVWLMTQYKKRNLLVQLHFAVTRNINTPMFEKVGRDAGFDVMTGGFCAQSAIKFLDKLSDDDRPTIILYSLNPSDIETIACISGAYRNVYVGAAWWFNDTHYGIRKNLTAISEYATLGTHLGMLTDSRSFSSYSRFDFFRRILCSYLGEMVEKGEYGASDAEKIVVDICHDNIANLLGV